jgi:hypothetical protein
MYVPRTQFFLLLGPTPIVTTQEECLVHLKEADYLLIMVVYWSVRSSDEVANHGLHLGKCRNTFVKDEKNAKPSIPIYPKICFVKLYIRFLQKALVSPQLQFDTTP